MESPNPRETQTVPDGAPHSARGMWLGLFLGGLIFCLLSIWLLDEPMARFFARRWREYPLYRWRIDAPVMLAPIAAAILILVVAKLRGTTATRSIEALTLAAYSALSGFAINNFLLKEVFARQSVGHFLRGDGGFFRPENSADHSFPSGHSVLVAAILVTLWRYYPRWYPLYVVAMTIVALLLLAGNWHFLSDIVAGGLWGALAAHITALLWRKQTGANISRN